MRCQGLCWARGLRWDFNSMGDNVEARTDIPLDQIPEKVSTGPTPSWPGKSPTYAREETLYKANGKYIAQWAGSMSAACDEQPETAIDAGAIQSVGQVQKCGGTGPWVVACNHL